MPLFAPKRPTVSVDDAGYADRVAPQAVEVLPDALRFPHAMLLPISARAENPVPGARNPWRNLRPEVILTGFPMLYSVAVQKLLPAEAKKAAKRRRVVTEAVARIMAEKAKRRPSGAEMATIRALDGIESAVALGEDLYRMAFLAGLFAPLNTAEQAEGVWRTLENRVRAAGLIPQRLYYIAEQAVFHLQPGGDWFSRDGDALAFLPEFLDMLPRPSRPVPPAPDAVWLGRHPVEGRDVYFSFREGLDPTGEKPTHNITLILGEQGSGKTTLMRLMLTQRLLQGRAILSIDPEGENNHMVRALGGEVVPAGVPDDKETCLLHPLQADTPEEMFSAVRFFLYAILGDIAMTPTATAVIHEAVQRRWQRRPGPMGVSDLMEALSLTQTPDGQVLAAALRPYARGGLWEGFFDRPKSLLSPNLKPGEWRSFDLTSLRDENKAVVMTVLGWFVYHAITAGRQPMDVFIDEGWYLLRSPAFRDLLDEIGRRGRKRDVGIVFITHLPADLAKDPTSLSLASTAFIGFLPPEEAYRFFRSLGVPEDEARSRAEQVARLGKGKFMAAPSGGRGSLFPLHVIVPPPWQKIWREWGTWQKDTP